MNPPLARRAVGRDRLVGPGLVLSLGLLVAGLFLPSVTITSALVFRTDYSIIGAVIGFARGGNRDLFLVTGTFACVFPLCKIVFALRLWYGSTVEAEDLERWAERLLSVSKWSMLDVFVIALLILAFEGSLFTTASLGTGIILFAGAIVLSTWALRRISRYL